MVRRLRASTVRVVSSRWVSSSSLILEQERHIHDLQRLLREEISCGNWNTAASAADDCLQATEAHFSKEHTAYASALNNCALVKKNLGKEEEVCI